MPLNAGLRPWTGNLHLPVTDNPVFRSGVKWVRTCGTLLCIQKLILKKLNRSNGHVRAASNATCLHSVFTVICWCTFIQFHQLVSSVFQVKTLQSDRLFALWRVSFVGLLWCLCGSDWLRPYGCWGLVGPAGVPCHCCPAHWSCHGQAAHRNPVPVNVGCSHATGLHCQGAPANSAFFFHPDFYWLHALSRDH